MGGEPKERSVTEDRILHPAGELPETGAWVRLEVPLEEALGEKPGEAVQFRGMRFHVDGGRAFVDRPGTVVRRLEKTQRAQLRATETLTLEQGEDEDRWEGQIPVETDCLFALEFRNALGHANAAMKKIQVVATKDLAPSLMVEKPGKSLTIARAQAVPLVVRAFDDFGLEAVGLQLGPEAEKLGDTRWLMHLPYA